MGLALGQSLAPSRKTRVVATNIMVATRIVSGHESIGSNPTAFCYEASRMPEFDIQMICVVSDLLVMTYQDVQNRLKFTSRHQIDGMKSF
tara:strand:+ start:616218 stop:616487 length:270 start_codon:yes stop_codon:yes gene_type:complete